MKSKLLKRLLSVMLVGTAVFSLAACSGANGEKEQPETQTEESTKTQEMEENTDAGETADIRRHRTDRLFFLVREYRGRSPGDPGTDRCGSV